MTLAALLGRAAGAALLLSAAPFAQETTPATAPAPGRCPDPRPPASALPKENA